MFKAICFISVASLSVLIKGAPVSEDQLLIWKTKQFYCAAENLKDTIIKLSVCIVHMQ